MLIKIFICVTVVDCGIPDTPDNGTVLHSADTTFKSLALYDCDFGYSLVGPQLRSCLEDGEWSEEEPYCQRKAKIHIIES